jgi:hypothetical protein
MSQTSFRFAKPMEDKEAWLAALLDKDPEGAGDVPKLCATAALIRGALSAIEPPESVQNAARLKALATHEEIWKQRGQQQHLPRAWPSRLGSWLQVAFNLFRRR